MIDETDLKKIISESIKVDEKLDEAYVAQPKVYSQSSDLLSQRLKDGHVALYKGYIQKLNEISARLDAVQLPEAGSVSSDFRSLKVDETFCLNAVYLHELYFSNCFDPHSEIFMDMLSYMRLERDFGTFERWQRDFMATAVSAREGWAVCGYNIFLRRLSNVVIDSHNVNIPVGFIPLVVVDMWSHAFHRDYINEKESYVIAMMRELNWGVIEERFKKIDKVAEALR